MIETKIFGLGLGVGLLAVLPVGPVNILCLNRALRGGVWTGLAVGFGSLVADVVFAGIALFGIKTLSVFFIDHLFVFQLIGALFLSGFGVYLIQKKAQMPDEMEGDYRQNKLGIASGVMSGFFLTITNPAPLIYFASAFAPLGLAFESETALLRGLSLVLGVALGAFFWWAVLSGITGVFHRQIGHSVMRRINIVSGFMMLCLSLFLILSLVLDIDLLALFRF